MAITQLATIAPAPAGDFSGEEPGAAMGGTEREFDRGLGKLDRDRSVASLPSPVSELSSVALAPALHRTLAVDRTAVVTAGGDGRSNARALGRRARRAGLGRRCRSLGGGPLGGGPSGDGTSGRSEEACEKKGEASKSIGEELSRHGGSISALVRRGSDGLEFPLGPRGHLIAR